MFEQHDTRSQVRALLKESPFLSIAEIARRLEVSRQRVFQIIKSENLTYGKYLRDPDAREQSKPKARLEVATIPAAINSTAVGTISELLVAADLIARGWCVFFPLVRTTKCDLIATSKCGNRVIRIEVRSGRRVDGQRVFKQRENDICDHYAIVIAREPVGYDPALPEDGAC